MINAAWLYLLSVVHQELKKLQSYIQKLEIHLRWQRNGQVNYIAQFILNYGVYVVNLCRGGPVPDRLSATLISRKFAVARACVRGPSRQADVSAAG